MCDGLCLTGSVEGADILQNIIIWECHVVCLYDSHLRKQHVFNQHLDIVSFSTESTVLC